MSRLASFKGPSAPSSSPVRAPQRSSSSPSKSFESTYLRKTRQLLTEFHETAFSWDELLSDGQEMLERLINTRTELENEITLAKMTLPPPNFITSRIQSMERCLHGLAKIGNSSQRLFEKMTSIMESMEQLLFDACQNKGPHWTQHEPLQTTWSLDHLTQRLASLVHVYHQTNFITQKLIAEIRPHDTSFSESSQLLAEWIARFQLTRFELEEWGDIIKAELTQ